MRKSLRFPAKSRILLIVAVMLCCLVVPFAAVKFASAAGTGTSPKIKLSKVVGPPTRFTKVTGANFGASETVKLYFDTKLDGSTTTTSTGTFSFTIKIPRMATPGNHTIKATGQTSRLSATAPFLVRTDWSQAGFDAAQTRYNLYENVISASNASQLTNLWANQYTQGVMTTPIVVNGRVFISADKFYALDATTGAVIWSASYGAWAAPAVDSGIVYVPTNSQLYALKASTGALLWSDPINGGATASPTVAHGIIYVPSYSGNIYAINGQTGQQVWEAAICPATYIPYGSPAISGEIVYTSCADNTFYSLNSKTGAVMWTFSSYHTINCTPVVANGMVYITDSSGLLYALNAQTLATVWAVLVNGGQPGISDASVVGNTVYIANFGVFAYNAQNGGLLWSSTVGVGISSDLMIANGVVYFISNDANAIMFSINAATGASIGYNNMINSSSRSMPVIANGMVFVGAGTSGMNAQGNMYAFSLKS